MSSSAECLALHLPPGRSNPSLQAAQSHSSSGVNAAARVVSLSEAQPDFWLTGGPRTRNCVTGGAPGLRVVKSPAKWWCVEDISIIL